MADDAYGPGFREARKAALARSNGVCQACGHFRATQAHHWQKRTGRDAEITSDHLTGLCDLCHETIAALHKDLAGRLTEKQKRYIEDLLRKGGYHFPDEGFVQIAETLFLRYISGEGDQLEEHHSILLGAWRSEGKRRISDLTKSEAHGLINTLEKGDWPRPAPEPAAPSEQDSDQASTDGGASPPRVRRRWAIIVAFVLAAGWLLAYSGEKNTMRVIGATREAVHHMLHAAHKMFH